MLDILKGKEPEEDYLIICRGIHEAVRLCRCTIDILKSVRGPVTYNRPGVIIHFRDSYHRIRFVSREGADRAAIGFRGKVMYGYQVERMLEELGTVS